MWGVFPLKKRQKQESPDTCLFLRRANEKEFNSIVDQLMGVYGRFLPSSYANPGTCDAMDRGNFNAGVWGATKVSVPEDQAEDIILEVIKRLEKSKNKFRLEAFKIPYETITERKETLRRVGGELALRDEGLKQIVDEITNTVFTTKPTQKNITLLKLEHLREFVLDLTQKKVSENNAEYIVYVIASNILYAELDTEWNPILFDLACKILDKLPHMCANCKAKATVAMYHATAAHFNSAAFHRALRPAAAQLWTGGVPAVAERWG